MKKLALVILYILIVFSCVDKDEIKKPVGSLVEFVLEDRAVKTVYNNTNQYQIDWLEGDQIKIFCKEAFDVKHAKYYVKVDPVSSNKGSLNIVANGLKWGDEMVRHNFYSVYPADSTKITISNDSIFRLRVNNYQVCELGSLNNGVYLTIPDMTNSYLVSKTIGYASTKNKITIDFKPIMTTLDVMVKGRQNEETIITGISIHYNNDKLCNKGEYLYDFNKDSLLPWTQNITSTKETIFVGIKYIDNQGTNLNSLSLKNGEKIKLTAFLPPIVIDENNPIEIMVHSPGASTQLVKLKEKITARSKRAISLSEMPPLGEGSNNWITPLDDNIYISQLSIPGTHDTGTGHGTIGDGFRTQSLTFEQQWDMGIRVFDIRTAHSTFWSSAQVNKWEDMWLWHGDIRTYAKLKDHIIDVSLKKLKLYPKEFVILQFKNEGGKYLNEWAKWIGDLKSYLENNFPNNIVNNFDKDLTIKDLRGKILILSRNVNFDEPYNNGPLGGYIVKFPDNEKGEHFINAIVGTNTSADVYIQDYYKPGNDSDGKKSAVKGTFDEVAKSFVVSQNKNEWIFNFLSGYAGLIPSKENYQKNAQNVHPEMYKYITSKEKIVAPLGMCMMDWVGYRVYNGYQVYGDLLPQAIIDNNYKCRPHRKYE